MTLFDVRIRTMVSGIPLPQPGLVLIRNPDQAGTGTMAGDNTTQLSSRVNVNRLLTVFGPRGHVEVHPLSAGADEAHEKLLDGVGVVGGEGGPVGGVHPQLACPLPALQSRQ